MIQSVEAEVIYGPVTLTINNYVSNDGALIFGLDVPRARQNWSISALLQFKHRVVDFFGRQAEMDDLVEWITTDYQNHRDSPSHILRSPKVRIYTGSGGEGKSRLAQEICYKAQALGWQSGFIDARRLQSITGLSIEQAIHDLLASILVKSKRENRKVKLLFALDYVEAWPDTLIVLFRRLSELDIEWRLLCLARHASWNEGWLQSINRQDPTLDQWPDLKMAKFPHGSHGSVQVICLEPAITYLDRELAFRQAFNGFYRTLHGIEAAIVDCVVPSWLNDRKKTFLDKPLILHILALALALGEDIDHLSAENKALEFAVNREINHLKSLAISINLDARQITRLGFGQSGRNDIRPINICMAALILGVSPVNEEQAFNLLSSLQIDLSILSDLAYLMNNYRNGMESNLYWEKLEPDLLSEHLIGQLSHQEYQIVRMTLTHCSKFTDFYQGISVINRLASRTGRAQDERYLEEYIVNNFSDIKNVIWRSVLAQQNPLLRILEKILDQNLLTIYQIDELNSYLPSPDNTVVFRKISIKIRKSRSVFFESMISKKQSGNDLYCLDDLYYLNASAEAHTAYAISLTVSEYNREALEESKKAIAKSRRLTASDRQRYLPRLVDALNVQSILLHKLGDFRRAKTSSTECVNLCREMVLYDSEGSLQRLGLSLNTMAIILSDMDKLEDAHSSSREAVEVLKNLKDCGFLEVIPDLALCLASLANILDKMGDPAKAALTCGDSIMLFRQLSEEDTDAFLPKLALALRHQYNFLNKTGEHKNALKCAEQAYEIYTLLAEHYRPLYLEDMAICQKEAAYSSIRAHEYTTALQQIDIALLYFEEAAAKDLSLYKNEAAYCTYFRGVVLSVLGRFIESENELKKYHKIYSKMKGDNKRRNAVIYANSCHLLGEIYLNEGLYKYSSDMCQIAIHTYTSLAKTLDPDFESRMADVLTMYGLSNHKMGNSDLAIESIKRAIEIYDRIILSGETRFIYQIAKCIGDLGFVLLESNQIHYGREILILAREKFRESAKMSGILRNFEIQKIDNALGLYRNKFPFFSSRNGSSNLFDNIL